MSKLVKNLITKNYKDKFVERDGLVVINFRGIKSNDNVAMRAALAEKGLKVTVVKNSQAKRATEGTDLEAVNEMLDGSVAFVYTIDPEGSVVNVARTLVDEKKTNDLIDIRGAVMENSIFADEKAVEALSKYPTREEAIAQLAGALLGPASTLSKVMTSPGENLGGALKAGAGMMPNLLKAIEEKGGELKKAG